MVKDNIQLITKKIAHQLGIGNTIIKNTCLLTSLPSDYFANNLANDIKLENRLCATASNDCWNVLEANLYHNLINYPDNDLPLQQMLKLNQYTLDIRLAGLCKIYQDTYNKQVTMLIDYSNYRYQTNKYAIFSAINTIQQHCQNLDTHFSVIINVNINDLLTLLEYKYDTVIQTNAIKNLVVNLGFIFIGDKQVEQQFEQVLATKN